MPQERNSATSPHTQCSVPTTEQLPAIYGNGEALYPTSEGNMAMYTDSQNSLVVSGTGRTYSNPSSPQAMLISSSFTHTTTTTSYCDSQLPLSVHGDATTLVIPDDAHLAYANAISNSNNPMSFGSSEASQIYGDDHPNEACNTHNSNREKLHNKMLPDQYSFPVDPLDSGNVYFQDYSSSSHGNEYFSDSPSDSVNLASGQYNTLGISSMVTGVGGGMAGGGGTNLNDDGLYMVGFQNNQETVFEDENLTDLLRILSTDITTPSEMMVGMADIDPIKFIGLDDPSLRPPECLSTPVDSFINGFSDFSIQQPVQAGEAQNQTEAVSQNQAETLRTESLSQNLNGESVQEQSVIGDHLAMIRMMKVPTNPPTAPTRLGFKGSSHMVPTSCIPSPLHMEENPIPPSPVEPQMPYSAQPYTPAPQTPLSVQPYTPAPQTPLSVQPISPAPQTPLSVQPITPAPQTPLSKQPYTPVTPVQASAPPPSPAPATPRTPATPSGTSQNGPFDLKCYTDSGKRICEVGVREDLRPDDYKMAVKAVLFSLDACQKFEECLKSSCDLKVAIDARAKLCEFKLDQRLQFTMPQECMHLDKWLHVNRGKIDLRDRQLVLQQVINLLAAVHTIGSEFKLCLWGSFVVWVAPDNRVYLLLDFPEMLAKMENHANDMSFDPRVEDVKAIYALYKKIFQPFLNQDSSWVSPGVKQLLQSFETLVMDPSSVYRMAECARILGEKRLCKLEVEIFTINHYVFCIEHEPLKRVLEHITSMVPRDICDRWGVFWAETRQPVGHGVMASARHHTMRLMVTTSPMRYGYANDQELTFNMGYLEGF